VAKLPDVTAVTAIPKEVAWKNLVQELGISDLNQATQQLAGNPLVDELKVKVRSSQVMAALAQKLAKVKGVEEVRYVDEAVQRVAQLNQGLNWVSLTVTTLLTLTAIAVITTTIRLIVMARRREIEVMQLVGATSLWIYLPFILQGLVLGMVGASIAWGFIAALQHFLKNLLFQQPELVQFLVNGLQPNPVQRLLLPLILLGFGGAVGLLGSLFAVRTIAPR
jgi:cell division transport system permease protein